LFVQASLVPCYADGTCIPTHAWLVIWPQVVWRDTQKIGYAGTAMLYSCFIVVLQVVWKDTQRLGCAVKMNCDKALSYERPAGVIIVVCRYFPPGNFVGADNYVKNVLPLGKYGWWCCAWDVAHLSQDGMFMFMWDHGMWHICERVCSGACTAGCWW
jgi:hypothetical protein